MSLSARSGGAEIETRRTGPVFNRCSQQINKYNQYSIVDSKSHTAPLMLTELRV